MAIQSTKQISGKDNGADRQPNGPSQENSTKSKGLEIPQITLPKGGGALKGIDEKFSVNAANGTSSFSIPLPVSPGRNGFTPSLSLSYNSGAGNSPFGLGWDVGYPAIQRKSDRQLPRYQDETDGDVFMFAGAEDLVPAFVEQLDGWKTDELKNGSYQIKRYRPRVEGLFARIEKIQQTNAIGFYWKVTTKDNTVTFFGKSLTHRLADPNDPSRIYQWLPEISFNDKGNCTFFEFKAEDKAGVENTVHEKNRLNGKAAFANQYLKRVSYGNVTPYRPDPVLVDQIYSFPPPSGQFLFEVVLDYGEHGDNLNTETTPWLARPDPSSDYRAGFEIRTYRLCQRVLLFHLFTNQDFGLADNGDVVPYLIRSLDLTYQSSSEGTPQQSEVTYLTAVSQTGYIKEGDSYTTKLLPPMEFSYQKLHWNTDIKRIAKEDLANAPVGLSGNYQWVDLYAEGISGILTEQAEAWYYKRNLGEGTFTKATLVAPKPSFTGLSEGILQLQDLDADGTRQVVSYGQGHAGFFTLTDDNNWLGFRAFDQLANVDLSDPNIRVLDLTGDGKPDLVVSEEHAFVWYASLGTKGHDSPERAAKPWEEEQGPAIVFADRIQSIFLADMSGDGLTDIVRIRNGNICYWPNLGYGRFGAKVTMSRAPMFDLPDAFNPSYLHLADVSGTGATDLLYLGKNKFRAWLNLSGNAWSDACEIDPFPGTAHPNDVSVIDLLGNGTSCIVWSSPLPANDQAPMRYIDLMGGQKPHLLRTYKNNLGKETTLHYKSSALFYLADRKAGRPWITKLPFPVNCLSKVEVVEQITKTRFVSEYAYHHGYYDHAEREFRGFGLVEQTDTEAFEQYQNQAHPDGSVQLVDEGFHQPPILTKSWFHTGAFLGKTKILNQYAHEYYRNEAIPEQTLAEPDLPAEWNTQEWQEALRACKGMPLRVEVYSLDGSAKQVHPYTTAHHSCLIRRLQPQLDNKHAVFLALESEALTYAHERNPVDPRIAHSMTVDVDRFGNVLQAIAISYGRKTVDLDLTPAEQQEQRKTHVIVTQNRFTNAVEEPAAHRLPLLCETQTYELTGVTPATGSYFSIRQLSDAFAQAELIAYQTLPTVGRNEKRLIEQVRTTFRSDDLTTELDLGVVQSLALPYQAYQLALTPALVNDIFGEKVTEDMLLTEGRYLQLGDADYWIASGTQTFDADHFYQVTSITDPFGYETHIEYDTAYRLFMRKNTDELGNTAEVAGFNFRTLSPYLLTDANDNRSGVRFDTLGMVVKTFVMGKAGEEQGDPMDVTSVESSPNDQPTSIIDYDLFAYQLTGKPVHVKTSVRETHHFDSLATGPPVRWQTAYAYSDGNGREIMRKVQAKPGLAKQLNPDGTVSEVDTTPNLRWVGNGRTILNNKGNPVKQYEPYFSTTPAYEDAPELVEGGVSAILRYDSLDRLIRTDLPNGTFSKVVFDAWMQQSFDPNDTVFDSTWYKDRILAPVPAIATPAEIDAANKAAAHANTPARSYLDSMGRNFMSIADNGVQGTYKTTVETDLEGNVRKIVDARGNAVMHYRYDMLGNQLYSLSMDAGERWGINDAVGKPLRGWDNRNQEFSFIYDRLHRPTHKKVAGGDGADELNHVFERISYGENVPDDKARNLRRKPVIIYDTAGKAEGIDFDFKGNSLTASRQFATDYKAVVNWSVDNPDSLLDAETFRTATEYDALNRVTKQTSPDGSVHEPAYNEAGLLETVRVTQNGLAEWFVKNIDYDEKGQRKTIKYGNDITTTYGYDPETFRLTHLQTKRLNGDRLQDLHYTFDPFGNITRIDDRAIPVIFFNNQEIEGINDYTYDAIYQLKIAKGRELATNSPNFDANDNWHDSAYLFAHQPGDPKAMRYYTQRYQYDSVGNILQMQHAAGSGGSWTRDYAYESTNNRLRFTKIGTHTYTYPHHAQHGFITSMPHLQRMLWNFKEELQAVANQKVTTGTPETTWYVYDGSGQRARKITERQAADGATPSKKSERIYVGGTEVYREYDTTSTLSLERQTYHVMDDQSRIAMIETRIVGTDESPQRLMRYQFGNHLGSACLETDATARVISYEEYHPYGTTAYQAINSDIKSAAKRYRYTGMERDEESGLEYHSARYYLPWLGRWLSSDPIGIGDGVNIYCYVKGHILSHSDRSGLGWGWLEENLPAVFQIVEGVGEIAGGTVLVVAGESVMLTPLRPAGMVVAAVGYVGIAKGSDKVVAGALSIKRQEPVVPVSTQLLSSAGVSDDDIAQLDELSTAIITAGASLATTSTRSSGTRTPRAKSPKVKPVAPPKPTPPPKLETGTIVNPGKIDAEPTTRVTMGTASPTVRSQVSKPQLVPRHKNDLLSEANNHIYEIHDNTAPGTPYKYGVSGQELNKNGTSPRANLQVNELNALNPVPAGQSPRFTAVIIAKDVPRKAALSVEQHGVNSQQNTFGKPPAGNQRPKPNGQYGPGAYASRP